MQAAEKLLQGPDLSGKAYFITNNEPYSFWGFVGDVSEGLGYERPRIHLPWLPLYFIALFLETVISPMLGLFGVCLKPADFNSYRIKIAACERVISCQRAMRDLGYKPKVSLQEGVQRTVAHFHSLRQGSDPKKAA